MEEMNEITKELLKTLDEEDARRDAAGEYFKENYKSDIPVKPLTLPELNPDGSRKK